MGTNNIIVRKLLPFSSTLNNHFIYFILIIRKSSKFSMEGYSSILWRYSFFKNGQKTILFECDITNNMIVRKLLLCSSTLNNHFIYFCLLYSFYLDYTKVIQIFYGGVLLNSMEVLFFFKTVRKLFYLNVI